MYHFTDGGLRNVWLKNGYMEKDTPYGKAVSFYDLPGLTKTICDALVRKPGKLNSAEFRYIRNAMELSQRSLGKLLGCSEQAVAKWEKQGRIPKAEDFLIRRIYAEKLGGDREIEAVVEMLNAIDGISHSKIIVSQDHEKWTAQVEIPEDEAIQA